MLKDAELESPLLFYTSLFVIALVGEIAAYASTGLSTLTAIIFLCTFPICLILVGILRKSIRDKHRGDRDS
jgi:hypothetical protein